MNDWYSYGLEENTQYQSNTAQINCHIDLFNEANTKAIEENTSAIEDNTASIQTQTQVQTEDAQLMRTNQTTLFGNLIKTIKSLFSKEKDESISGETFYEMVQRENNETQEYLGKFDTNSKSLIVNTKTIGDNVKTVGNNIETVGGYTKTIADNTKVIGDNVKTVGDNTKSISDSLKDIISKLESIKTQDKANADEISAAISKLKLIVNN